MLLRCLLPKFIVKYTHVKMKAVVTILVLVAGLAAAFNNVEDDQCPPEQGQDWTIEKLLRHEDCNKFYKCTFGYPVEMTCPNDLFFNLATWQCDWQHNVDCTDRIIPEEFLPSTTTPITSPPTTTTTTPAPTTTTTTTTPAPTTTTTTTIPASTTTTTPAPTTTTTTTTPAPATTTTTTTPASTTTTTTTTPAPNITTTTTTTPAPNTTTSITTTTLAPNTTTSVTTTPTSNTTTTTTTTQAPTTPDDSTPELNSNGCPVNPHIHWLLPHEEECNLFYYCVWGKRELRECPATTHFNRVLQVCDFPYRAGCINALNKHMESRRLFLANM